MTRLARLLKKCRALLRMRLLEIELAANLDAGDHFCDEATRLRIHRTRRILRRELVHARMRLAEFDRPGQRRTYDIA